MKPRSAPVFENTPGFALFRGPQAQPGPALFDLAASPLPSRMFTWSKDHRFDERAASCWFGFVHRGPTRLRTPDSSIELRAGQYFCVKQICELEGGEGVIFERCGVVPMTLFGGPLEPTGRLKYIDGCSDSLLVPPVKLGFPCMNALYFPPGIDQTPHTHQSLRLGLVASGRGLCRLEDRVIELLEGDRFAILEDTVHSFQTSDQARMVVIAYHPDSDHGPQDHDHPMINRTFVQGVSAAKLPHLATLDDRPPAP